MRLDFVSTHPELHKTTISGDGLRSAVAGRLTPIHLRLSDQYGNPSTPGASWRVGLAITNSKKKVHDLDVHPDFTGEWSSTPGDYVITYIAKQAGTIDLHVWCEMASAGREPDTVDALGFAPEVHAREPFPGSPFALHVTSGEPVASKSYLDGWTLAAIAHSTKSKATKGPAGKENSEQTAGDANSKIVTAGDTVSVRAFGVDQFENPAHVVPEKLRAVVVAPDGTEIVPPLTDVTLRNAKGKDLQSKAGTSTTYEVRHDTIVSGTYGLHVFLEQVEINNSPIAFEVEPSAPVTQQSILIPPDNAEALVADPDNPSVVMLHTLDRFGNRCTTGGLRVSGRCLLVKQGPSDNTILMPNNHSVTFEDRGDGTYSIFVVTHMTATVKCIVNMDKDLPGTTGELPPIQLSFIKPKEGSPSAAPTAPPPAPQSGDLPAPDKLWLQAEGSQHGSQHGAASLAATPAQPDAPPSMQQQASGTATPTVGRSSSELPAEPKAMARQLSAGEVAPEPPAPTEPAVDSATA